MVPLDDVQSTSKVLEFPGSFGEVHFGMYHQLPVAIKYLSRDKNKELAQELQILSHMREHPRILNCYGYTQDSNHCNFWVLYEYSNYGTLNQIIVDKTKFPEIPVNLVLQWMQQLLEALNFLHSKNMNHTQIKTENIFVFHQFKLKLGGFTAAKIVSPLASHSLDTETESSTQGSDKTSDHGSDKQLYSSPSIKPARRDIRKSILNIISPSKSTESDKLSKPAKLLEDINVDIPAYAIVCIHICERRILIASTEDYLNELPNLFDLYKEKEIPQESRIMMQELLQLCFTMNHSISWEEKGNFLKQCTLKLNEIRSLPSSSLVSEDNSSKVNRMIAAAERKFSMQSLQINSPSVKNASGDENSITNSSPITLHKTVLYAKEKLELSRYLHIQDIHRIETDDVIQYARKLYSEITGLIGIKDEKQPNEHQAKEVAVMMIQHSLLSLYAQKDLQTQLKQHIINDTFILPWIEAFEQVLSELYHLPILTQSNGSLKSNKDLTTRWSSSSVAQDNDAYEEDFTRMSFRVSGSDPFSPMNSPTRMSFSNQSSFFPSSYVASSPSKKKGRASQVNNPCIAKQVVTLFDVLDTLVKMRSNMILVLNEREDECVQLNDTFHADQCKHLLDQFDELDEDIRHFRLEEIEIIKRVNDQSTSFMLDKRHSNWQYNLLEYIKFSKSSLLKSLFKKEYYFQSKRFAASKYSIPFAIELGFSYLQLEDLGFTVDQIKSELQLNPIHQQSLQDELTYEIRYGKLETIEKLIELGANIYARDGIRKTALMIASENGRDDIVNHFLNLINTHNNQNTMFYLLKVICDQKKMYINKVDAGGRNALMLASMYGYDDVVKRLVEEHHADVHALDDFGENSVFLAASKGHHKIVYYLVDQKGVNPHHITTHGFTCLMKVAQYGFLDLLQYFHEQKRMSIHQTANNGYNALMLACEYGHRKIVKYLVDRGAEINFQNKITGRTALMIASAKGHFKILQYLCENGANIYLKDKEGKTAETMDTWEPGKDRSELLAYLHSKLLQE